MTLARSNFLQLEGLKEFIDQRNQIGCLEFVQNIALFFDNPHLTKAELEFALECLFDREKGTPAFMMRSIQAHKLFHDSNVVILSLWIQLLEENAVKTSFTVYADDIVECCMKFIISNVVSTAKEREKAAIVMLNLFQNKLVKDDDTSDLLSKLLDVFNLKNLTEMFAQQVFRLLGTIAKECPQCVLDENSVRIRDVCIKTLEDVLLNEETIRNRTLAGAMEGLNLYLSNFAPSPDEDPRLCRRIYVCVKKLSDPPDYVKQKAVFQATLELFRNHKYIFANEVYTDFKYWHDCLHKWLRSDNYEYRRSGFLAVYALQSVVADRIKTDETNGTAILRFFLNYFQNILQSFSSSSYESRIAIRGFGLLSFSCKTHFPEMLDDIISLVVQRSELISIVDDSDLKNSLEHFPDYIQALSTIVKETQDQTISDILVEHIQNVVIRLIRDFHYLSGLQTNLVVNSLTSSFFKIFVTDATLLERLLGKVIMQGVIWTCSHKLTYEASNSWKNNINWKDNITYTSYNPLWQGLLECSTFNQNFEDHKTVIAKIIFNHLMQTLFTILEKLDLRTKKRVYVNEEGRDEEFHFCDPNFDLCPVKLKDFHIYFNLVEFYRDIFWSKYRREHFRDWINDYCTKMIRLSLKNPLLSGFIKLLQVGLNAGEYINYFNDDNSPELQMELCYFLKHLIVKCQRVSGELQIAVLELILKYPVKLYSEFITEMIPILETSLDLGKSMMWLAKLTIDCIDRIISFFHEATHDLRKLYIKVLPYLDSYLQGKNIADEVSVKVFHATGQRRSKLNAKIHSATIESDLLSVQTKILSLLGKLDAQNAGLVVSKDTTENLVKWDIDQSIHLTLKLSDMNPKIYLDDMVPRICHLAITSADRKTKIAACEVVHTIILYLLGTRNHQGQIWKKLCSRILILGADGDKTVQEMFKPMLFQVMHFMSRYENLNRGVDILMDALMEGICNYSNCALRDLSAMCLREFVEWSIRQTTPEQLAASPVSIDNILDKLKVYSFDSNASRRVGAALAFNNLYRILRENETICDIFFVDLLHAFCVNFKLSEELSVLFVDSSGNSDLDMISTSLDHVVRVLRERNYLYNKVSQGRHIPNSLNNGTLADVVKFLVSEARTRLMSYRQKCIAMAISLAPYIDGITSLKNFLGKDYITSAMLMEICEGPSDGQGIKARPDLSTLKGVGDCGNLIQSQIFNWLEHFLGALDRYVWLLGDFGVPSPQNLFVDANILEVISFYLKNVCWTTMSDIIDRIESNGSLDDTMSTVIRFGTEVLNRVESLKCIIVCKLLDFINLLLRSGCADKVSVNFWAINREFLANLVVQLIFEPHRMNFDFRSGDISRRLPDRIETFLRQVKRSCPDAEFVKHIDMQLIRTFNAKLMEVTDLTQEILSSDRVSESRRTSVEGIFYTLKMLNLLGNAKLSNSLPVKVHARQLLENLFSGIKQIKLNKETIVSPPSDVCRLANRLMCISLLVDDLSEDVVRYICDSSALHTLDMNARALQGEHFFNIYKKAFCEECNCGFLSALFKAYSSDTLDESRKIHIVKVLSEILDYLRKHRKHDVNFIKEVFTICLDNLSKMCEDFMHRKEDLLFIEYIATITTLTGSDLTIFRDKVPNVESWIIKGMKNADTTLEHKSRVIAILPLLIGPDDYESPIVMQALEGIQRRHIPLVSTEFQKNSLEEISLKSFFKSLLSTMVTSRSFIILEFIIRCTALEQKHIVEYLIREELKLLILNLNEKQQEELLNRIFKIAMKTTYQPDVRLTILRRFLISTFVHCHENVLVDFFTKQVNQVNSLAEANYAVGKSGILVEQALVNRIIAYSLIEQFFGLVNKEQYFGKTSPVAIALVGIPKTDSELIGIFTKKAYYTRTEIFTTDDKNATELFRQYQCASYRALCSLVSNTQTKLEFYSKFLFEENILKNEFIWSRLIDCSTEKNYTFGNGQEQESCKIKDRFIAIRQLNVATATPWQYLITNTSKLLQTQNIMESSLSQDVSAVDMNLSKVRTHSEALARCEMKSRNFYSVQLERHDINQHEVMPMLCGVIKFMFENNINPTNSDRTVKRTYRWITVIAQNIGAFETHKNVRLFLAQVVANCNQELGQFAHVLFRPILKMILDWCAGTELNFFITDMIAMLLNWTAQNWHKPSLTEEGHLVSELLRFVMQNAWNEKTEIFKYNVEIIRSIIAQWKECITLPDHFLLDMMNRSERKDSKANECGVILFGMMLQHNFIPWNRQTKELFVVSMMMNLNNDYTVIYQPAGYAVGLSLAALQKAGDTASLEDLRTVLTEQLKSLSNKNDSRSQRRLMDVLYAIHKSYPEIVDQFRELIGFRIPSAIGVIKKIYLEMLLSRIGYCDETDIFPILISIGIKDLLRRDDCQLLALHIVNRSMPKLLAEHARELFEIVQRCLNASRRECRDVAYEICIYVAQHSPLTETKRLAFQMLLNGIVDEDEVISNRIYHFWSQEANISQRTDERIASLLAGYANDSEKHFLGLCVQLILDPAIHNPDSKRQIFEFETDRDTKFYEYIIDTKSRIRSSYTLPPLFADSQLQPSQHGTLTVNNLVNTEKNEYFFEPTQDPSFIAQSPKSFTISSQNSLPFAAVATQSLDRRSHRIVVPSTGGGIEAADKTSTLFRRRFLRKGESEKRNSALRVIDFRKRQAERVINDLKTKANNVVLYRRYRFGDYPDLLINSLAFLLPMQALARRDTVIARQLFVMIFNAVLLELGPDSNTFIARIDEIIQSNLRNSKTYESSIFATFLELTAIKPSTFNLAPDTVASISKLTKKFTVGAIYLENRLNADWDQEDSSIASKSNASVSVENEHWLQLADIYSSLREYDVVAAIFSDKIRSDTRLAEAIELKANGHFDDAQNRLLEVINRNVFIEHYYAYNCYYDCFLELGDWSSLSHAINHEIDDFEDLWTDDYNKNFLLPKLVQAELQLVLQGDAAGRNFLRVLEGWMKSPEKVTHMKNNFCEELMMFHISNQEFRQSRVYCENFLQNFLTEWSATSTLCTKLKLENLLNAQKVAEIDHYALLLLDSFDTKSADVLLKRWECCSVDGSDSLRFWNSVLAYRCYIACLAAEKLEGIGMRDKINDLKRCILKMDLQFFNATIQQKNISMAEKILNRWAPDDTFQDAYTMLTYDISKMRLTLLRAERSSDVSLLETAFTGVEDVLERGALKSIPSLHVDALTLKSQIVEEMLEKIHRDDVIDERSFADLLNRSYQLHQGALPVSLTQRYVECSFKSLARCIPIAKTIEDEESQNTALADVEYRLALFSYNNYDRKDVSHESRIQWEETLLTSVFHAMKYGSKEARQLFPCVLQLPSMENGVTSFHAKFREHSEDVPEWMFLPWIPQILSRFDYHSECYLDEVVQKIAEKYPNALRFPFNVWYDRVSNDLPGIVPQTDRPAISRIVAILHNNLLDKFMKSFKYFAIPEAFLISQIEHFASKLHDDKLSQSQYQRALLKLIIYVYPEEEGIQGNAYRRLMPYKESFEHLYELSFSEQASEIYESLLKIRDSLRRILAGTPTNVYLSSICPWIANFQWCGEENYIEMPGQYTSYTTDKRPSVLEHMKIVKFDKVVRILISQRYPLRITIHGSNAKSYDFLVKYGEDLKQDQRVQQILSLMSQKLSEDQNCRKQNLFIRTYQVVPIDCNCGLLSWVDDTVSLHEFVSKSASRHSTSTAHSVRITETYMKFIKKPTNYIVHDNVTIYGKAVSTYTRAQIIQHFRALENVVSLDILKKALVDISVSPESFFVLRYNFATSLAAMNIAHWILGVGDRHMKNSLISVKDATMTGIDFGYTFGAGTRDLGVPEMTPFRLTPHFVHAMTPMGTSGLIFKSMAHSLRVFRQSQRILMACMEVFIREPTVNWLHLAQRQQSEETSEDDLTNKADRPDKSSWEPKDRVDIARCKLLGFNPMYLVEKELTVGRVAKNAEFFSGYIRILRGDKQFNIRARLPNENLSVEEQIKCLIDQATDPAILGVAYVGFAPWM